MCVAVSAIDRWRHDITCHKHGQTDRQTDKNITWWLCECSKSSIESLCPTCACQHRPCQHHDHQRHDSESNTHKYKHCLHSASVYSALNDYVQLLTVYFSIEDYPHISSWPPDFDADKTSKIQDLRVNRPPFRHVTDTPSIRHLQCSNTDAICNWWRDELDSSLKAGQKESAVLAQQRMTTRRSVVTQ